jgi:uncharacterized coiled-coil DUF342 family protein
MPYRFNAKIIDGEKYVRVVDYNLVIDDWKKALELRDEKIDSLRKQLTECKDEMNEVKKARDDLNRRMNIEYKQLNDEYRISWIDHFKTLNKYTKTINDLRTLIPKDKLDEFDAKSD